MSKCLACGIPLPDLFKVKGLPSSVCMECKYGRKKKPEALVGKVELVIPPVRDKEVTNAFDVEREKWKQEKLGLLEEIRKRDNMLGEIVSLRQEKYALHYEIRKQDNAIKELVKERQKNLNLVKDVRAQDELLKELMERRLHSFLNVATDEPIRWKVVILDRQLSNEPQEESKDSVYCRKCGLEFPTESVYTLEIGYECLSSNSVRIQWRKKHPEMLRACLLRQAGLEPILINSLLLLNLTDLDKLIRAVKMGQLSTKFLEDLIIATHQERSELGFL